MEQLLLNGLRKLRASQLLIVVTVLISILSAFLMVFLPEGVNTLISVLFSLLFFILLLAIVANRLIGFRLIKGSAVHEKIALRASQGRGYYIASICLFLSGIVVFLIYVGYTQSLDGLLLSQFYMLIPMILGAMSNLRIIQITGMLGIISRNSLVKDRAVSLQRVFWFETAIWVIIDLIQVIFGVTSITSGLGYVLIVLSIFIFIIGLYMFIQLLSNLTELILHFRKS